MKVLISMGERYISVHAGTKNGFIPNAELIFKAKSSTGNYHSVMNGQNFEKWLCDKLIPNLPAHSVVVLDNAPYHTVKEDKFPTAAFNKAQIKEWLQRHNIDVLEGNPLKATLLQKCKENKLCFELIRC